MQSFRLIEYPGKPGFSAVELPETPMPTVLAGRLLRIVFADCEIGVPMSREIVVQSAASGFLQTIEIGPHRVMADEPKTAGGSDAGPNPYELLLAALGACTSMTLRMYADRKSWPLEHISVVLSHSRNYAQDCADCDKKSVKIDRIERRIFLRGDLSDEQRARLLAIANRCPVHASLASVMQVETHLSERSFTRS